MSILYEGRVYSTLRELAEEFDYSLSYLRNHAPKRYKDYDGIKRGQQWYFDRELFKSRCIAVKGQQRDESKG
ncbi:MAG: hypothetical protein KC474_12325, partial [Cyanobacteria bacterium HKST-UBA04]|nr:hypothetical protein [Cyanobacteria bacterium HKST-UBA04]